MQPFLKWAGGKRWLFSQSFISKLPTYDRYVEPFLGGAAGFFAIEPQIALLSDINAELIELYEVVRDSPLELTAEIGRHQALHSKEHYYEVRDQRPPSKIASAARTLYLNRTCWNGLYRLNKKGNFNVPMGTKRIVSMPSDDFVRASILLKNAKLSARDFEETINETVEGDLLFVDPPYTVKHNMNGFVKYNENIFQWADQIRLRNALKAAAARGVHIILTNADHPSVRDLYDDFGTKSSLSRQSVISGKKEGRSNITELMVQV